MNESLKQIQQKSAQYIEVQEKLAQSERALTKNGRAIDDFYIKQEHQITEKVHLKDFRNGAEDIELLLAKNRKRICPPS